MPLNRSLFLSLLWVLFSAGLSFAEDDAQKAVQGKWLLKSIKHSGTNLPAKALAGEYEFKGNTLSTVMTLRAGRVKENYTVKLDTSKKPWTIDQTRSDGRFKGKTYLGIYKIEKSEITICIDARGQGKRPSDFLSSRTNGRLLVVLSKTGATGEPTPKPEKKNAKVPSSDKTLKKLPIEGTWRLVKSTSAGTDLSQNEMKKQDMTMRIEGSKCFWKSSKKRTNGSYVTEYSMSIDWSQNPVHIDLNSPRRSTPMEGILKMEDGQLVFCLCVLAKKSRPSKFESKYGEPYALLTFKKEK